MLQAVVLVLQSLYLGGARLALRVAQQPLLSRLQKLLGPPVVEIRSQALSATQSRNALLAAQSFEDDPNLLFRRKTTSCLALNVADDLLRALSRSNVVLYERADRVILVTMMAPPYMLHFHRRMFAEAGYGPEFEALHPKKSGAVRLFVRE